MIKLETFKNALIIGSVDYGKCPVNMCLVQNDIISDDN